jgi:phosphoribosylformylglycinamidine synthase
MTKESDATIPQVNTMKNKKTYTALSLAIAKQLVASSIGVGRGGLAVALAKKAIGGQLGLSISLQKLNGDVSRDDFALYSESQGRILITVAKENKTAFEKLMKEISYHQIGTVTKERKLTVNGLQGKEIITLDLEKVTEAYRETFKNY